MSDERPAEPGGVDPALPGRREFLSRAGRVTAAGLLLPLIGEDAAAAAGPVGAAAGAGLRPVSMAMHVHASFSEGNVGALLPDGREQTGSASMAGQLDQATRGGVEVVWWTEHDFRMAAYGYRTAVHFDGPTETENGRMWRWLPRRLGPVAGGAARFVAAPAAPADPHPPGSLQLTATARPGDGEARVGVRADAEDWNFRSTLAGQVLQLDVHPDTVSGDGWLEVELTTSERPARAGLPAGHYRLAYRVGGPGAPGSRVRDGLLGVVTLPAPAGRWSTLRLTPAEDLRRIWGVDGRDASLYQIDVWAVARRGRSAAGHVDWLRFSRATVGADALVLQRRLISSLAPVYPRVTQHQALELTLAGPHANQYGGAVRLPDFPAVAGGGGPALRRMITAVHGSGGIASYNHPFGTSFPAPLPQPQQDAALARVGAELIRERAYGADLLEVGYPVRAGVDLAHHAHLWDALSRNAVFLTGTGVSDDHGRLDWAHQPANFLTWAWAAGTADTELLPALRAGRVFFGDPRRFTGQLDLTADGACPMGSVSITAAPRRSVRILATGIPAGGAVLLLRGQVDLAGPSAPTPRTTTVRLPATRFATGAVTVTVDTTTAAYVRAVILDSTSTAIAFTNPIWLLRRPPPGGIPAARRC